MQQSLSSYKQELCWRLYAAGIQFCQVLKGTMFFCSLFATFECWIGFYNYCLINYRVSMDNGQDLQYKKLNWFLECQKFLIFWHTITKILG